MSVEWYCRLMGTEMGPYTSKQLIEMARSHQLTPQDFVKKGADGRWVDAHRVKGLFDEDASSTMITANLPPELKKAAAQQKEEAKQASASPPPAGATAAGLFAALLVVSVHMGIESYESGVLLRNFWILVAAVAGLNGIVSSSSARQTPFGGASGFRPLRRGGAP